MNPKLKEAVGENGDIDLEDCKKDLNAKEGPQAFEDIIESLGSFGHWQRVIFFVICLVDIFGSFSVVIPIFIGAIPNFYAFQSLNDTTGEEVIYNNSTKNVCPSENSTYTFRKFHDEFTSIVSEWDLVCDRLFINDLITTIQMIGMLLGALVGGHISDAYGRKKSYFVSYFLMLTGGLVSAFSPNYQLYAACRFVCGYGFGSTQVVNCIYPLEFVGHRWRTLCGTIGFWAVGQMILALAANFVRDWRLLIIVTACPGYFYFVTWCFLPESPRWLVQRHRFAEAHAILKKIADKNKKPCPTIEVLTKFSENDENEQKRLKNYTYWHLINNWTYGKLTAVVVFVWFTSFLVYYHLTFNLRSLSGNRYVNVVIGGLLDLVGMVVVIPANNIIGRRISLIGFMLIALVGNIAVLGVFLAGKQAALADVVLGASLIGRTGAVGATYVCQILTAEVYPTVVRNLGVSAGSVAGRIGLALAPQMVLLGMYHLSTPFVISTVLSFILIPLVFFLPETKGRALSDSL